MFATARDTVIRKGDRVVFPPLPVMSLARTKTSE